MGVLHSVTILHMLVKAYCYEKDDKVTKVAAIESDCCGKEGFYVVFSGALW